MRPGPLKAIKTHGSFTFLRKGRNHLKAIKTTFRNDKLIDVFVSLGLTFLFFKCVWQIVPCLGAFLGVGTSRKQGLFTEQ